ncbi:MAG: efflux RND transporter permease subunit [Thermoguttaceae bacterium]
MIRKLIQWSLDNVLIILALAVALAGIGVYSFMHINVEAYPDPASPTVEVVAQFPGASAEEVERQVTIPLEVTLAGMPGLRIMNTKTVFGLSDIKMLFDYGTEYKEARQETINRLQSTQPLPPGVTPQISPESPTGEIYRYWLRAPKDAAGRNIYTLNDLKALQDWVLEREFRTVPRVVDITSWGGTIRRYEVQPDPDRMRRYGVTLAQLQNVLTNSNATVGGDYVDQGDVALTVRSVGLFGGGEDPVRKVLGMENKVLADFVRNEVVMEAVLGKTASDKLKDRVSAGLEKRKLDPPLTDEDRGLVHTIERLRAVLASNDADSASAEKELTSKERGLLQTIQRIQERLSMGLARRAAVPPLSHAERDEVRAIQQRAAVRAAAILRAEEEHRIRDIRALVITAVNNQPVCVEDVVEGGRLAAGEKAGEKGVVVRNQTRLGKMAHYKVDDAYKSQFEKDHSLTLAKTGHDDPDQVGCIVLLRKGEDTLPALTDIEAKVEELNDPASGRMLPGVEIVPYYDRRELTSITTDTVVENLLTGIGLVVVVLLMFLSNLKTALIVALNIPLALLFAFSMLYFRGKSANLLSIGAVDFGIIVDSSVIIAENIYRHLATESAPDIPLKTRIFHAASEIDHALLFSTLIMVCAFIPLFTMEGPAGALFGPMAQTYASALGGALVLAVTLTPVLCLLCFKNLKPTPDNFLVRLIKTSYLQQLDRCLKHRWLTVLFFGVLIGGTACLLPYLGGEFMPQLEEGNLWIRDTAPLNISLARQAAISKEGRSIMASYPEVVDVVNQIGRTDDATDTDGYYNSEFFVPLRPQKQWPAVVEQQGWRRSLFGPKRPRTKEELVAAMDAELELKIPGVTWNFSQNIRDNVMESLSGVKGDNSLKIVGPDLNKLQELAAQAKNIMQAIPGLEDVGVFNVLGQSHLAFRVDPIKCQRWGVQVADVNNVVGSALGAKAMTEMIEGEKFFDVSIRWPAWRRGSETSILDIPIDVGNNQVVQPQGPGFTPSATGTSQAPPAIAGTLAGTANPLSNTPRLRLRDLVSPVGEDGSVDTGGHFEKPGAAVIYREQQKRLIAVKFSVRGRDLAGAVAEAQEKTQHLFKAPYRPVWSGEFEEMQVTMGRLMWIVPLSLGLIFVLLYLALRSWLDAVVVISNVFALAIGGVWALYLTGTNFSISAAVGFISLFGVAIMDGLLMISYFNALRGHGEPLERAIIEGAAKRVRPVMMTAMTALFGLLPAALSTQIGSETQRPLAIVVVGGMTTTILLTRYLMPVLYSFYGHREPPAGSGSMAH